MTQDMAKMAHKGTVVLSTRNLADSHSYFTIHQRMKGGAMGAHSAAAGCIVASHGCRAIGIHSGGS